MSHCKLHNPFVESVSAFVRPLYDADALGAFFRPNDLSTYDAETIAAMIEDIASIVETVRQEINGGNLIVQEHLP
ncbi:MAG: hypothetical protein P4M15_07305 [Alphaproteobacteria bacterium]|nr:hypothetical protein [Alphaproteobacteria bacterium]